jgi:hypothetical protein
VQPWLHYLRLRVAVRGSLGSSVVPRIHRNRTSTPSCSSWPQTYPVNTHNPSEQSPMSKDESLDSASQAGWFLHLGPVRCGTGLVGSAVLQRTSRNRRGQPNLPKLFLFYLDNNSHAQANSGFRLLRSYMIWLHLEEASLRTCH